MQAIIILNSSAFERSFPIPTTATPEDVQRALDALVERGGLDAAVVAIAPRLTGSVAAFLTDVEEYANAGAAEIAAKEGQQP